ncbi:MAG: site-specific integrase [Lentimicrobiaceae bacterium]|jgi:site-specific recombinase XerD
MTRATFNVLYYINRGKKLKNGTVPIYARITVNKQRSEFAISRFVEADEWNVEIDRVMSTSKSAKEINSYLDLIKSNLLLKKREMEEMGRSINAHDLKNIHLGIDTEDKTILMIFQEHNIRVEGLVYKDFSPGTLERYKTCYSHLKNLIKEKYKKSDMILSDINPMFITEFEYYLKTTRKCCNNTTIKYIKNFKKIVRIALANGRMKADPFRNITFHLDDVDMAFLTEDELNILMKKQFQVERLQQVKDVYLFCCFTGLAFVDVKSLKQADIEDKNGELWIKKKRQKTKNWCNIPLLEPAIRLMTKYQNYPQCVEEGRVLPVLMNQKMNAYLKEIADITGIKKSLSTHTARHTFATTVTLANQVSMEVVSKMLGHSSINMTKKYARVVDDLVSRDMQKLVGMYDKVIAN